MAQEGKLSLILPVLFYEYLAISITKSLIPSMLLETFPGSTYVVIGVMETVKGLLAFVSSPVFGRVSDIMGRKYCLLVTVVGSTMPVCLMAFTSNVYVFVVATALSGLFAATFPLTFAYIADCTDRRHIAPAYGMALASFGLAYCVGPVAGSYLAAQLGARSVFAASLLLVIGNAVYIVSALPETVRGAGGKSGLVTTAAIALEHLPAAAAAWSVADTFRVFNKDSLMRALALVVFLYYTAVWALVSTLLVHVARNMAFGPAQLGALMSAYGLATMVSEAVLVRLVVPALGERHSIQLGLAAFALQCALVAFARSQVLVAGSVLLSMLANLVYPAVSSLVSARDQGEVQGALNGIKALTEGFGPLVFGGLMTLHARGPLPGAPYLLGSFFALFALLLVCELPEEERRTIDSFTLVDGQGI